MINSPLNMSQVQATLNQTTRQRHSLLARIDVFIVVFITMLLIFWLSRRPWGLALEIFIAACVRAPGRRLSLALSRGSATGRGGRRRAVVPTSRRPVVARRYAGLRHRAQPISAGDPSNGARRFFRRAKITVKGAPCGRVNSLRSPLTVIFYGEPHWHLSSWTGRTRGRANEMICVTRTYLTGRGGTRL